MTPAYAGSRAIGEAIESNLDCARYLAQLVDASEDFDLLAPVELVPLGNWVTCSDVRFCATPVGLPEAG